jgi:hypothetical protein
MTDGLSWRQEAILAGILRDQRAIAAAGWHAGDNLPPQQRGRHRMAFRRASEGLVAMNLASWLGYVPTPSDRVGLARDCQRLADMGLLERHNLAGGARTTHLRLTEAGRKVAEGILGAEEPPIATGEPLDLADLDLSSLVLPEETDAPATP